MRAVRVIRAQGGPLAARDPNCARARKRRDTPRQEEVPVGTRSSLLGLGIDLQSERARAHLSRTSSHAHQLEMSEMEQEAAYFEGLERREEAEDKMAAVKEVVCDVVSCLQCAYTASSPAERCRAEQHPLKRHRALKKFFACAHCRSRRTAFTRYPTQPCRHCHLNNFKRTTMFQGRAGPGLGSLSIRGEEQKFIK